MLVIGLIMAALAALVHGYIFVLESLRWTDDATRRVFRTTPEQAEGSRSLAFNQGFYNLFLGLVTAIGIIVTISGAQPVGLALIFAGVGCMLGAALVLVTSSPALARPAAVQGAAPALCVIFLALHVALS